MNTLSKEVISAGASERELVAGKLKPPELNQVIRRTRLLDKAKPGKGQKVVLISAGAGYGKTTLLAQIASECVDPVVWYQVDDIDRDPLAFLRHLIYGINQSCGGACAASWRRINQGTKAAAGGTGILDELLEDLSQGLNTGLTLCIDDLHVFQRLVPDSGYLDFLIRRLPATVTLIMTSRGRLRYPMGRLRSFGSILEMESDDLIFSREEMRELLVDSPGRQLSEAELNQIYQTSEGWATGLVLIKRRLANLKEGESMAGVFGGRVNRDLHEYLAEEVLERQTASMQKMLMGSSIIDPVDPGICGAAMGIKRAGALLSEAHKLHLFTFPLTGEENRFRYHTLFREFLQSRLKAEISQEDLKRLQAAYGEAFERSGRKKKAVEHYLKSDRPQEGVRIIKDIGQGVLDGGEKQTMDRWLDSLEKPLPVELEFFRGQSLLASGRPREALRLMQNVKTQLGDSNPGLAIEASIRTAECFCKLGRPKSGALILEPLLEKARSLDLRIEILYRLSLCYLDEYNEERVAYCISEATKLMESGGSSRLLNKTEAMLSGDCLRRGNFFEARRLLSSLAAVEELSVADRNLFMNNLASSLTMLAEYDDARNMAEKCFEAVRAQKEERRLPFVYDTYGCCLVAKGENEKGEALLRECVRIVSETDANAVESCAPICHLGTHARRMGEITAAIKHHRQCLTIARNARSFYDWTMGLINLGADAICMGRYAEARKHLSEALNIANRQRFDYACTQIDFHFAWLYHQNGDPEKVFEHLTPALSRARRFQHNHFLIQEGKITVPLFTFALSRGIEEDYVCWILERMGKPALRAIVPLVDSTNREDRLKCANLLSSLRDPAGIALARKLRKDSDREVKQLAAEALTRLRGTIDRPHELLTAREMEVLQWIASGATNALIASGLFISERTVKTHATNIFRKLGLTSRVEAALYYQNLMG